MTESNRSIFQFIDIFFLALMILFLPSLEGPKNIFWGLFLISWFILRWREGNLFAGWNRYDTLILLCMFAGFLVAPFAGIDHDQWKGGKNIVVYMSVLLLLKHSNYSEVVIKRLLWVVLVSSAIATFFAFNEFLITKTSRQLELHSVGHVNHTAIYLVLTLGVSFAILVTRWAKANLFEHVITLILAGLFFSAVIMTSSRAALMMAGILPLFIAYVWRDHSRILLKLVPLLFVIGVGGLFFQKAAVVEKQMVEMEEGRFFEVRDKIWRSSMLAWRQFPVFGVGPKNYIEITQGRMEEWLAEEGKEYDESRYIPYAHAHNLILSTLVEQGLVGAILLISLLIYLCFRLIRSWPQKNDPMYYWAAWIAASCAMLTTLGIGVFNTTLHHEHGILTMLLIGLCFNAQKLFERHQKV